MKTIIGWLDQRTGINRLAREALFENVPGGARWRYVWGSTLVFCFAVQVITGLTLWLAYSPGSQTAWESVFWIQHVMWGGWFLRGLHHFTAQAMIVLLALHLMQVVIDGAYKAPREVNFWTGILLLLLVLALSLTGYLLPWDQKGYWASKVATNIAGITPLIGPAVQKVLVGGADFGHATLTRFFALHAGFIPGAIIAFIVAHVYLFRRHGLTPKEPRRKPDAAFWPDQVLRDAVACLAVLSVVVFFVLRSHGAPLDAPAEPNEQFSAARPEWYFLFLFQLLRAPGVPEIVGAMVLPAVLLCVLVAMPYIGRSRGGHRFNLGFLWILLGAVALLTFMAVRQDRNDSAYMAAVRGADVAADRAVALALAPSGIPVTGAVTLLRNDAMLQGAKLFARNCASCHRFDGGDGLGNAVKEVQSASDLKNFASREWLAGLFDPKQVDGPNYFGGTKHKTGKMVKFVKEDVAGFGADDLATIRDSIMAVSAEAGLPYQAAADKRDAAAIDLGRAAIVTEAMGCTECHQFRDEKGDGSAPKLSGFGSRDWLVAFISNPKHDDFFGPRNDRMPAFGTSRQLTEREIGLIADWLRHDWYMP